MIMLTLLALAALLSNASAADDDQPTIAADLIIDGQDIFYRVLGTSTWVSAPGNNSLSYQKLFEFINGHNTANKISRMAAPVIYDFGRDRSMFYLPRDFVDEQGLVPRPLQSASDLQIEQMRATKMFVKKFHSFAFNSLIDQYTTELEQVVASRFPESFYYDKDNRIVAEYVDPLEQQGRRNEVWLVVEVKDFENAARNFVEAGIVPNEFEIANLLF